jgi:hypothetical protein
MKNKGQNILDTFLELLKVKHTKDFTGKLFNEHPHKYNLFGLSKMFSDFWYSFFNAAHVAINFCYSFFVISTKHDVLQYFNLYCVNTLRKVSLWQLGKNNFEVDGFCDGFLCSQKPIT